MRPLQGSSLKKKRRRSKIMMNNTKSKDAAVLRKTSTISLATTLKTN